MLYMKDWEVCAPPGFSLGFEGDNGATVLEVSTDLTEEWDLKVDVEKDGEKNIPVEEIAEKSHSFNYEFVCSITNRVPRKYLGE